VEIAGSIDSVFCGSMGNGKREKARCGAAKANAEIGGVDGQPFKDPFCENLRIVWKQKGARNISCVSNIFSTRFKKEIPIHGSMRRVLDINGVDFLDVHRGDMSEDFPGSPITGRILVRSFSDRLPGSESGH
jgi:hypothetical protein